VCEREREAEETKRDEERELRVHGDVVVCRETEREMKRETKRNKPGEGWAKCGQMVMLGVCGSRILERSVACPFSPDRPLSAARPLSWYEADTSPLSLMKLSVCLLFHVIRAEYRSWQHRFSASVPLVWVVYQQQKGEEKRVALV